MPQPSDTFHVTLFLTGRGVRTFTVLLTSSDYRTAKVENVVLSEPEPAVPEEYAYELTTRELEKAWDAAEGTLYSLRPELERYMMVA